MIKFILIVISLYLIISNPWLILIVGGIAVGWQLRKKKPDLFSKLPDYLSSPPPKNVGPEPDLSDEEKDFETTAEKMARSEAEIEKKMKPGYQDDPEWQKKSRELNKHRAENRARADKEMQLEMLQEAEEYAKSGNWSEVNKIQKELQDMEANS